MCVSQNPFLLTRATDVAGDTAKLETERLLAQGVNDLSSLSFYGMNDLPVVNVVDAPRIRGNFHFLRRPASFDDLAVKQV